MPNYITVLNSDLPKEYWRAVQWDDSLSSIQRNRYYTAGYNLDLPKNGEQPIEDKVVTETATQLPANAVIVKLTRNSSNLVKLASNKASKKFMKSIE